MKLKGEYEFMALDKSSVVHAFVESVVAYRVTLEYEDGKRPYVYYTDSDDLQDEISENGWVKTKEEPVVYIPTDEEVRNSEPMSVLEVAPPSVDTGRTPESSPEPEVSVQPEPFPTGEVPTPITFRGRTIPFIPEGEQWVRHKVVLDNYRPKRTHSVWHELRYVRDSSYRYGMVPDPWITFGFWCGSFKHVTNREMRRTEITTLDDFFEVGGQPWEYVEGEVCKTCWAKKESHSFESRENTKREVDRL